LGVVTSTVTRLETSEADDTISLATLRRAAEALDCELRYVLVPRQSLADTLATRANQLARERMAGVAHSMALEAQATSSETVADQTRALADSLLQGPRRELWREKK
jgi:predicted DNA-binding mobile mystery protein A